MLRVCCPCFRGMASVVRTDGPAIRQKTRCGAMDGRGAASAINQCSSNGNLSGFPQNSCRWGENQLGYFRIISLKPSLPPRSAPLNPYAGVPPPELATGATIAKRSSNAPDQYGFPGSRDPSDNKFRLIDRCIRLQIIHDSRDAPRPALQESPVIFRVSRVEARSAECPTAVRITELSIFAAIGVIECHEGKAVCQRLVTGRHGFHRSRNAKSGAPRRCRWRGGYRRRRGCRPRHQQHIFAFALIWPCGNRGKGDVHDRWNGNLFRIGPCRRRLLSSKKSSYGGNQDNATDYAILHDYLRETSGGPQARDSK